MAIRVKARLILLVAALVIVGGFIFLAYRHHVASVERAAGPKPAAAGAPQDPEGRTPEGGEDRVPGSAGTARDPQGSAGVPTKRSYADLMAEDNGFGMAGLGRVALSLEELQWLNRHGMPSVETHKAYWDMSIDDLTQRASAGDVNAAVIGAQKLFMEKFGRANKDRIEALNGPPEVARQALEDLMSSDEWKAQRVLLGKAVIGGSSYAAQLMSRTFQNPVTGACSDKLQCDAWLLVAWRMGDWTTILTDDGLGQAPPLTMSLDVANRLWDGINRKRAELGLPPMEIDLRPNHDLWLDLQKNPNRPVEVYHRQ